MPSALNVGGTVTRRPGVYGKVDASALGGQVLETNVVALVGEFPFLQKAVPTSVVSQRRLVDLEPADVVLPLLAKLLYNPASDSRITGAPARVMLMNAKPCTQAIITLDDVNGVDSLDIKAVAWGLVGNKVTVMCEGGTQDAVKQRKFTIFRDGFSEVFDNIESGDVVSFNYTQNEATAMTVEHDPASGLLIKYTKSGNAAGTYVPNKMAFDGAVTVTPSGVVTGTVTVNGINKATGLADTEVRTFTASAAAQTTTKTWSSISSIVSTVDAAQTYTYSGTAFSLMAVTYDKASKLVDRVNTFASQGFTATSKSPEASATPTAELDKTSVASILGVEFALRADIRSIIRALANSALVVATRAVGAKNVPAILANAVTLAGGTETTSADADWTAALDALKVEDVQIIALLSSVESRHKLLRAHCEYMAGAGANERNGWVGLAARETLTTVKDRVKALNTRHLSLMFQAVDVETPDGTVQEVDPTYLAVLMAGMQAGRAIATPLTHKRPNVLKTYSNANINVDLDAEDLLKFGLCFITRDRLGLRVERSLTTYLTDDNPIFSEMSANESINTSIRDLRAFLTVMIGDPGVPSTANRIKSIAKARLREQVASGIIKAFNEASLTVTDLGDRFKVSYEAAAIEPINFIDINLSVRRMPVAA